MEKGLPFTCPICHKEVQKDKDCFPFCSERCKLIDLGKWAGEDYRIKGRYTHTEEEE